MISIINILLLLLLCLLVKGHGDEYLKKLIKIKQGGYQRAGQSRAIEYHEVIFCIKQKNRKYIEELLIQISTPGNEKYGKHLTRQQIADLTANPVATKNVIKYLEDNGITYDATIYGEYIKAKAPISTWERVFSTKFDKYYNDEGHSIHRSRDEVIIPSELSSHVNFVMKTTDFPLKNTIKPLKVLQSKTKTTSNVGTSSTACADGVDISCLNSFYGITINRAAIAAAGSHKLTQAVYESENQTYSVADLATFQQKQNVTVNPVFEVYCNGTYVTTPTANECQFVGPCTDEGSCAEANLDVQYIMGIAQNVSTAVWYVTSSRDDPWGDFVVSLADSDRVPNVISISYAGPESQVSISQFQMFDTEAIKLGLNGTTIVVASGDDGVGGDQAGTSSVFCGYNAYFPASSPWVTAVGASQFSSTGEEVACQGDQGGIITSGGGFSVYYDRPNWQQIAVTDYFSNLTFVPYPGYNIGGRGYPDISLLGFNYTIVVDGEYVSVSGTSASAPVFAAMLSLINANRLANSSNHGLLGWINPALYEVLANQGQLFAYDPYMPGDIIKGNNKCTAMGRVCCAQGFSAGEGWDPVTGLGSVNFTHMNTLLANHVFNLSIHTSEPSYSPTIAPQPTAFPTHSPLADLPGYYAYISTYENSQCSGVSPHVSAFQTERCYQVDNLNLWVQFQCGSIDGGSIKNGSKLVFQEADAYYAQVGLYTDSNCESDFVTQNFNYGCSQTLTNGGYISSQVLCSNSSTYQTSFPVDTSGGQTYNVLQGFLTSDGSTCKDCSQNGCSSLLFLTAYLTNHCFTTGLFGYALDAVTGIQNDGSFKFSSSVVRRKQKLSLDAYVSSNCKAAITSVPLKTDCSPLYYPSYYSDAADIIDKLSSGVIAAIVLSVLFVVGATGYFFYRRMLFKRQVQSSLLSPLNSSSNPVPAVATRIPAGTIVRVTPHVNPVISVSDSVPNPLIATQISGNANL